MEHIQIAIPTFSSLRYNINRIKFKCVVYNGMKNERKKKCLMASYMRLYRKKQHIWFGSFNFVYFFYTTHEPRHTDKHKVHIKGAQHPKEEKREKRDKINIFCCNCIITQDESKKIDCTSENLFSFYYSYIISYIPKP